ncbi:O-antigen polymerase [uncultured Thiomicrorhabdus sp.]
MLKQINIPLVILVFFACLFSIENIGKQSGIASPYNLAVYIAVILLIFWHFFLSLGQKSVEVGFVKLTLIAVWLLAIGSLNGVMEDWFYQSLAVVIGLVFIFSLAQNHFSHQQWLWLFYALCILGLIQALIAFDQRFDRFGVLYFWTQYFPFKFHSAYLGSLQQKNMFATFMAFAVVLSLYVLTFLNLKLLAKIPLFLLVLIGAFEIFNSGSRAGLLALLIATLVLLLALKKSLKENPRTLLIWLGLLVTGYILNLFVEPTGSSATDKLMGVVSGVDARLFLYGTGWEMFLQQPWFGYGIGGYTEAFQRYIVANDLSEQLFNVGLGATKSTHPHNELLFWLLQVGIIGIFPLLLLIAWMMRNWWQQGKTHFLTAIALTFPLLFQAMVSYPFTLSALHYFLTLLMLFYFTSFKTRTITFSCPLGICILAKVLLITLMVGVISFGYKAFYANFEIYYFKNRLFLYKEYPKQEQVGYFRYASKIPWFENLVQMNMQNLFENAVRDGNFYDLKQYLLWYQQQSKPNELMRSNAEQAERLLEKQL